MKRGIGLFIFLFILLGAAGSVSAAPCNLGVSLLNQDPYPAIPGDYVKVVFQVSGIENPECGTVSFSIKENFPFTLDDGETNEVQIVGGKYVTNFRNYLMVPYKLRVDENALEGDNEIETRFTFQRTGQEGLLQTKRFTINVEDSRTDFEVSVKDYNSETNVITFEILNIGESDIEALTVDVPDQDNMAIKGSNRNIVGDLDSNEDTTFTFEAIPQDGDLQLMILYTDAIGVRRGLDKTVEYHSEYFTNRKGDEVEPRPLSFYLLIALIVLILLNWLRVRYKKKRKARLERERHHRSKK